MTGNTEIVTSDASSASPFVRIVSPHPDALGFRASSYFRLGGYAADEGDLLPTGASAAVPPPIPTEPRVTRSTTAAVTYSSSQAYAEATGASSPTTSEQAVIVTTSDPIACSGAGVLIYANGDLMTNTVGSAFTRYGGGHGTVALNGDVELDVPRGQYTVNALNRIALTAGTQNSPADIVLTAYNTISQTALGPSDSVTYGDSRSVTHGNGYSEVYGNTVSKFFGDSTSIFLGYSKTWALDDDVTAKFANSLLLFAGNLASVVLGLSLSVVVGNMSYLYLATYAELYATAFVSAKFGAEIYVKDFGTKYAATEVNAVGVQADVVEARAAQTAIDLASLDLAMHKRTIKFDADGFVTEMSETRMMMSAMSIHM